MKTVMQSLQISAWESWSQHVATARKHFWLHLCNSVQPIWPLTPNNQQHLSLPPHILFYFFLLETFFSVNSGGGRDAVEIPTDVQPCLEFKKHSIPRLKFTHELQRVVFTTSTWSSNPSSSLLVLTAKLLKTFLRDNNTQPRAAGLIFVLSWTHQLHKVTQRVSFKHSRGVSWNAPRLCDITSMGSVILDPAQVLLLATGGLLRWVSVATGGRGRGGGWGAGGVEWGQTEEFLSYLKYKQTNKQTLGLNAVKTAGLLGARRRQKRVPAKDFVHLHLVSWVRVRESKRSDCQI